MTSRRHFIVGLLATGLAPKPSWADAGAPAYLSAAGLNDGSFALCGISTDRRIVFQIPLPARGHAAAAHPSRPEAVAFARRPGTFAVVIDCVTGRPKSHLEAESGRHFYGHGAFSKDGRWLFTTENDYEAGVGRVGVWDAAHGYARVDEFASGGVGPHDIKRLPGGDMLVVANGGIETHPDTGRTKLNIPIMEPNLSYIEAGRVVETQDLPRDLHKNSIRHLAVSAAGLVAFGMQWQGDEDAPVLVGTHRLGSELQFASAPQSELAAMQGYIGSIAFTNGARQIAVTSPRGGLVQLYGAEDGLLQDTVSITDASGVAPAPGGVIVASGTGQLHQLGAATPSTPRSCPLMWDNHLVAL